MICAASRYNESEDRGCGCCGCCGCSSQPLARPIPGHASITRSDRNRGCGLELHPQHPHPSLAAPASTSRDPPRLNSLRRIKLRGARARTPDNFSKAYVYIENHTSKLDMNPRGRRTERSRGHRLLIAVLQLTTAREVAARCGVSPSAVSFWLSNRKSPGPHARGVLETLYRIPRGAWDEPARTRKLA